MILFATYSSPFGPIEIGYEDEKLLSIRSSSCKTRHTPSAVSDLANTQLQEYFQGRRTQFDLPVSLIGTSFQLAVWNSLLEIPYGEVRTYSQIASRIGKPKACRAVGQALNRNPLWIVVPCHRVIGKNLSLTGYAGGPEMKRALLELEQIL